jgi:WD40 repeat protein
MMSRSNISRSDIPPGALISFLQKGLQYVGIEETIRQDGGNRDNQNHNRQREKGKGAKNNNSSGSGGGSGSGNNNNNTGNSKNTSSNSNTDNEIIDFTLLSPHAIKALIRRDPPIKLNVPPDAAAAAIRARLEAESKKMESQAQNRSSQSNNNTASISSSSNSNNNNNNNSNSNNNTTSNGPLATPQSTRIQQALPSTTSNVNANVNVNPNTTTSSTPNNVQATSQNHQQPQWAQNNRAQQAAQTMAMMNQQHMPNIRLTNNGYETAGGQLNATASATAAAAQALASVAHRAVHSNSNVNVNANANLNINTNGSKKLTPMNVDMNMNNISNPNINVNANVNVNAVNRSYNTGSNHISSTSTDTAVMTSNVQQPQQDSRNSSLPQQENELEKDDLLTRARPEDVLELNKHTSEVFMCAWNPVFTDLLATGSGDASARIWQMGGQTAKAGSGFCRLLQHGNNSTDKKNKDVTTLEWSSDGELLATGSYDGVARVWRKDGSIVHTLCGHMGPIFSLKWNKRGNYLLSGSYDKTTIVWNVSGNKGVVKQQFHYHTAPALDVDWKDDETFASCSTDKSVLICKVGLTAPLFKFTGHKDEVNAVKWDPSGTLLASCSDDYTAKVWNISSSSSNQPLHDFKSHKQEIYTVKW